MLLLTSCSTWNFQTKKQSIQKFDELPAEKYLTEDYLAQLKMYELFYTNNLEIKLLEPNKTVNNYLVKLADGIIKANELFFDQKLKTKITIVKSYNPFYFSLPDRSIFLSTGLLQRYVKHEGILASIIAYQLVRAEKRIYNRNIIVPIGYFTTEKMLEMLKLPLKERNEIHKWAYHLMRRAGHDEDQYLAWLQILNRNNHEFIAQQGEVSVIASEEANFKSFIIKYTKNKKKKKQFLSSKPFYEFMRTINRI
ncbi:MAG: hypothetical protein JNM93_03300 [Bacteriovoracaceae bacterium]|nr:hypothetical protein [Bacteriovoracaceae bacterium]